MPKCPTIDRVALTRKKFAKNLYHSGEVNEMIKSTDSNDWDGIHCPQCGKELRHVEGCLSCECGYFKC